jgi:NADH-quinone oxidoreductase subunit N
MWNRLGGIFMYDLYKNTGDIYIKMIIILLSIVFIIYSNFYVKTMKYNTFEYFIVLYFILMSFSFFILAIDVISFYLLLEIQSLSFYLLTALNKRNQYSVESGLKYFILSSFSSVSLLFGFSFLYGLTGTLNINELGLFFINFNLVSGILLVYLLSTLLILLAFLFKLYAAPFHLWISDIYQGAPTMVTAFFGIITALPLFYVFIKYYIFFLFGLEYYIFYILFIVSVLSMLMGTFGALYQKKIKRLIAFSSISNIGYVLIGFLQENPLMISHSLTYFILYIINSMGIFLIFLNLYIIKKGFFLERLSLLSGILKQNKILGMSLIIFFFTASGIPPFSLFFGKVLLLTGLSYQVYSIIIFILVITTILSSFYYLRLIKIISFENKKKWLYIKPISYINCVLILLLVFFQFIFFLYSDYITILSDYIVLNLYNIK